jgi:DNA-binding beta-propeller fold protein YncE
MKRARFVQLATFVTVVIVLGVAAVVLQQAASAQMSSAKSQTPLFQVDPLWPKVLPNKWVIGSTIGLAIDSQNHVWIIHRPATIEANEKAGALKTGDCCFPAPPVLEFDQAGNLVSSFGAPGAGYEWPDSEHGIFLDHKDNVWIGANGAKDSAILKFTKQGKFLLQIGKKGMSKGSGDTANLKQPANIEVDGVANEVFVADGYGNKRVIVYDADTGAYKRHWGAYGKAPDDTPLGDYNPDAPPPQQFRGPVHCASLAKDGLVYVCDRTANRIQVFQRNGTYVKEAFLAKRTLSAGAVWDVDFSRDAQQQFLYSADGVNNRIDILLRDPMTLVTSFGQGGHVPGTFYGAHNVATDSQGNVYTVETFGGKRVQRFVYKGLGAVPGPSLPTRSN